MPEQIDEIVKTACNQNDFPAGSPYVARASSADLSSTASKNEQASFRGLLRHGRARVESCRLGHCSRKGQTQGNGCKHHVVLADS